MAEKYRRTDPAFLGRLWNNVSLSARLMLDRRVRMSTKLIPLAMIAYILSPIDLIPEFLLPFGLADDLSVFLLGLQWFIRSVPPDIVAQYQAKRSQPKQIIEGDYQVKEE